MYIAQMKFTCSVSVYTYTLDIVFEIQSVSVYIYIHMLIYIDIYIYSLLHTIDAVGNDYTRDRSWFRGSGFRIQA